MGALIGVTVLSQVDGDTLRPILAAMLILVGLRILVRFSTPGRHRRQGVQRRRARPRPHAALRFARGGPCAATGGVTNGLIGAWGPIVTPFLLHRGLSPRFAVGSVNTAEVAVATVGRGLDRSRRR